MSARPEDDAPAAWELWRFVVARIPREDVGEFGVAMAAYRDEVIAGVRSADGPVPPS